MRTKIRQKEAESELAKWESNRSTWAARLEENRAKLAEMEAGIGAEVLESGDLGAARKLSEQAPVAIGEIKRVSHAASLDEGLATEGQAFGRVFGSEDAKEGISAFLGKRRARFQGR